MDKATLKQFIRSVTTIDWKYRNGSELWMSNENDEYFAIDQTMEYSVRARYKIGKEDSTIVCDILPMTSNKRVTIYIKRLDLQFTIDLNNPTEIVVTFDID